MRSNEPLVEWMKSQAEYPVGSGDPPKGFALQKWMSSFSLEACVD
jgi:hypothetical protein